MTDNPAAFRARKGSRLLRAHIDLPPDLAARVSAVAAQESAATGERVSVQIIMRRMIRRALTDAADREGVDTTPTTPEPT